MKTRLTIILIAVIGLLTCGTASIHAATQQEVANYVRDTVLGGDFGGRGLWVTDGPLDRSSPCVKVGWRWIRKRLRRFAGSTAWVQASSAGARRGADRRPAAAGGWAW